LLLLTRDIDPGGGRLCYCAVDEMAKRECLRGVG